MPANATYHDLLDEAQKFIDNEQYSSAIDSYEKALKLDPNDNTLYYQLGWMYDVTGDSNKAKDYFQKAIPVATSAELTDIYNRLGNIYSDKLNDDDEAIKQYKLALNQDQDYVYALYNMARIYERKKDWENAIENYNKAARLGFKPAETNNSIGNIYFAKKDFDSALKYYDLSIKSDANFRYALQNSAKAWNQKGNQEMAIKFYERAIAVDKSFEGEGYNEIAYIYYDSKNWDKAIQYFTKVIEADYKPAATYNYLGSCYYEKQDFDSALSYYDLSLKKDPNYRFALQNSGKVLTQKGNGDGAIKFYQRAIAADEDYAADGYFEIGNIYYDQRNYDEAIKNYESSLLKKPGDKLTMYYLGAALQWKQDYEKAIEQFQKVIDLHPDYGYPYLGIASCMYAQGNVPKAIDGFQKAISVDKTIPDTYYQLGNLYLDQLNYNSAKEYFEKTLQVSGDYVYAQHNKAWIYEKLGQFRTSKEEWTKAKNLYATVLDKTREKKDTETAAKCFYYAQILNSYFDQSDPDYDIDKIRSNFERAITIDNESPYYRCMLVKFYNEQKMELENKKQKIKAADRLDETNTLQRKIDDYYMNSLYHYREGVRLLKQKLETKKDKYDLNDLGEFYLTMNEYDEAAKVYEDAIALDDKFGRAYVGFGVAQSKLNNYTEAIKNFKKALMLDPDDLNVQSNLADAYLKSEKLSLAEECYKNILNVAPCHVDALIGLAEHHKLLADQMSENKKYSDAEELLKQAAKLYNDLLDKTKDFKSVSRRLNTQETSSINYSVGYIKVKLYEIDEGLGFRALTRFGKSSDLQYALKSFKKITQEQPDFYKAQTAIKKINKQFSITGSVKRKIAPSMVFLISLLICLAAQFCFWIGRPEKKARFLVNNANLSGFISQNKLDFFTGGLAQIATRKFNSLKELQEDVKKTISGNDSIMHKLEQLPTVQISETEYEPIDSTIYISLTFGTLIFMVVGLYLGNISKLKVGAIELEKTTADTISTSPNLGIGN